MLGSAQTFPLLAEVLVAHPARSLQQAELPSLLPGKLLPWRLGEPGTLRPGACVSLRPSPLTSFQESCCDLRAVDSAS